MAFGSLGLSAITTIAFIVSASTTHIATYVVPVNEFGKPGKIVSADSSYQPTTAEIGYFLGDWVQLVRGKSTDGVIIRDNWKNAYHFITAQAEHTLNGYAKANDPFANLAPEARHDEVQHALPRPNTPPKSGQTG